jgi:DNA polymerase
MDARERLRRYLEQRRELGEQELVLDGMDVNEVLRIVGALGGGAPASPPDAAPERPRERPTAAERSPRPTGEGDAPPPADWREALRASGSAPDQLSRARTAPTPPPGTPNEGGGRGTPAADVPANADPEEAMARRKTAQKDPGAPRVSERTVPPQRTAAGPTQAGGTPAELPEWLRALDVTAGLAVGGGAAQVLEPAIAKLTSLEQIAAAVEKCRRCPLYATATHGVPGEGNPDADLVCVGEAPGANEDEQGRPFVGQSGQLLTKILAAIKLSREDVFICNVLKHRPPGNRNPAPDEVEACSPYLLRQLELVKPKVIVAFGTFAAQTLLGTKTPLGKLREQVHLYHGIPLVVTYHPAALLRNEAWKRPTWKDVQLARRILDRATGP